ncbi:MAG TPA: penicillin-binding protein 2 [Coxiellaceae bacterium]|nr:penicillin-binding protein 2 [Coxiellaceae bacterium]
MIMRFKAVNWRFYISLVFLGVVTLGVVTRLLYLSVLNRSFLVEQSTARIERIIDLPASRGMIMDRNGTPLAVSTPVETLWINPKTFSITSAQLSQLAALLQVSAKSLTEKIHQSAQKGFLYLERRLPPQVSDKIKALNIPGLHFLVEYKRFYPEAEVSAHVIGFTNVDDQGQEGLELAYDQWLSGKPGKMRVIKDRLGYIVSDVQELKAAEQGHDLVLSLDERLQYIAYRDLKEAVEKFQAQGGSVVVLDAKTGEILAEVNQPSYNPNNLMNTHRDNFRNRAVTDMFEPGSTIKPFTIALALMSKLYHVESKVDIGHGWMVVGGYRIEDHGFHGGLLNLGEILKYSSNIGAAKIMLSLSPKDYWSLLHRVGFGQKTVSGFPGEATGSLIDRPRWYDSEVASLAYGYGMAVTSLQLAQAYSVFANGGLLKPVSFLKQAKASLAESVMPPQVAATVLQLLEQVVIAPDGTGHRAQVEGYRVAGKTGTAYIAGPHGYDKHHYVSSFVGIAPVSNPALVVSVVIRDPHGHHFGAEVAAPVFQDVMGDALRLLNVPPDRTE